MRDRLSILVESHHRKCVIVAVLLLAAMIALTIGLGYLAPAVIEAYGLDPKSFQYNWLIIPITVAIVVSIVVAARTQTLAEQHKCYWIVSMVLFFPLSTIALLVRVIWNRQ